MSWAREVMITCDECGEFQHGFGELSTVADARRELRRTGWRHTADGRDLCDACVADRARSS